MRITLVSTDLGGVMRGFEAFPAKAIDSTALNPTNHSSQKSKRPRKVTSQYVWIMQVLGKPTQLGAFMGSSPQLDSVVVPRRRSQDSGRNAAGIGGPFDNKLLGDFVPSGA
jgi:hypothetical protein